MRAGYDIREDDSHLTSCLPSPTLELQCLKNQALQESTSFDTDQGGTNGTREWWFPKIKLMNGKNILTGFGCVDGCISAGLGNSL